jgi:hypothetical protein
MADCPAAGCGSRLLLDPGAHRADPLSGALLDQLGAEFIVAKVGDQRFRCQFFYSENEIFGTGRDIYDNLGDCVTNVLQLQADHHATRAAALPAGRRKAAADRGRGLPRPGHHMTLDKARQLLATQVSFGGGYNRNGARLIIADVIREHGQAAADATDPRIRLDQLFGFVPGEAP